MVTPSALESALEQLRNYESERWVTLRESEAAALLARLEAADNTMTCIAVVNRIEPLPPVVMELIAQYRNPAPAGGGE